jgi:hypothetical protein
MHFQVRFLVKTAVTFVLREAGAFARVLTRTARARGRQSPPRARSILAPRGGFPEAAAIAYFSPFVK